MDARPDSRPARSNPARPSALAQPSLLLLAGLLLAPLAAPAARAQQAGFGQTINSPQQERMLDEGSGAGPGSNILDATNPIELMNRIRRATALDNATPPRDAIDAALRDFEAAPQPAPATPGSSLIQAP
ncbi:MAG: hypothetical protein R6U00_12960 [Prochlorococcaceae cyanobacterium]